VLLSASLALRAKDVSPSRMSLVLNFNIATKALTVHRLTGRKRRSQAIAPALIPNMSQLSLSVIHSKSYLRTPKRQLLHHLTHLQSRLILKFDAPKRRTKAAVPASGPRKLVSTGVETKDDVAFIQRRALVLSFSLRETYRSVEDATVFISKPRW
jgi:hypothetical protein